MSGFYFLSGEAGALCKLDFQKAYDNIDWPFLDYVLEIIHSGDRWRSWMYFCLSSPHLSVLVNGSPKGFVKMEKCFRQGDPHHHIVMSL